MRFSDLWDIALGYGFCLAVAAIAQWAVEPITGEPVTIGQTFFIGTIGYLLVFALVVLMRQRRRRR